MSDVESMPFGLQRMARVIGVLATLKLVEHYGGTMNHYIPRRPRADHPWALVLGQEAFSQLCSSLGGRIIGVPLLRPSHGQKKRLVLELAARGLSAREIAEHANCSQRYAWEVLQGLSTESRHVETSRNASGRGAV